ncbi:MAG TPA: hypothetical protein EYH56_00465 [Nanoarchaeota archaeon]|nr:hypothetical protein [Nanoarchaeota archaeon]
MKRKGLIFPGEGILLIVIASILFMFITNLLISDDSRENDAISEMNKTITIAIEKTIKESGAILQVDLDSLKCIAETPTGAKLKMILILTATTKPAKGVTVVMKDSEGNILKYINKDIIIYPGKNTLEITFLSNASKGEVHYLEVSTITPLIHVSYDSKFYGKIVVCN